MRNLLSHLGFSNSAFAIKDETDLASSNSNQKPTASKTPARVKENYVCSICDMNCFKKSRLELHMRIHNKYRYDQALLTSFTKPSIVNENKLSRKNLRTDKPRFKVADFKSVPKN